MTRGAPLSGARARIDRSITARSLVAGSIIVAVGLWTLAAGVLHDMRVRDRADSLRAAENVVATIDADIGRNIELYSLSLQAVADNMKHPEFASVSASVRWLMLFDRSATAKHLGRIHVVDENGYLALDSRRDPAPDIDLSTRDYFVAHRDNADIGLFIGRPFVTTTGQHVIGISRRLAHSDGRFAGVVAGTLRLGYIEDLFRRVSLRRDSALGLMRLDGTLLMRWPVGADAIGRDLSGSSTYQGVMAVGTEAGHYEATASIDGVHRLYVFRRVAGLPLLIMLGISTDDIYAGWRHEAWIIGLIALVLGLATIGLALFAGQELRRRTAAEGQLAKLASTDGLTGVANRRAFDEALEREWIRATRDGQPVAVLMIDADHFKAYNDRYGHQAGDRALAQIAAAIVGNVRGAIDVAARYGGEEFAVVLPRASLTDAVVVGERIRAGVAKLVAPEPGNSFPTVSIGVASQVPKRGQSPGELIARADRALYEAKRNGRNRLEGGPVFWVQPAVATAAA
jgi:diguanylate cyclase (GGDEF)-like protein